MIKSLNVTLGDADNIQKDANWYRNTRRARLLQEHLPLL